MRQIARKLCLAVAGLIRGANFAVAQTGPDASGSPHDFLNRLWLSGQANVIAQAHPSFPSQYGGPNSFSSLSDVATSRILTLYTGFSLSPNTDFIFDVEATNGRDLNGSHGLGAFTNVDLAGVPNNHPYVARALIHHQIRLTKTEIEAERGPLQMVGHVAARRLDLYLGKLSMVDFFDVNAIGGDSHFQFLNWTTDNNAAYGYPADARGYTYAFLSEYHDGSWIFRFAEALTPKPDSPNHLDANLARSRSESSEVEFHHHALPQRVGVLRALAFVNHGTFGEYRKAVGYYRESGGAAPDITAHRERHLKYGVGLSIEQELTSQLRAYGRFGWSEGHFETLAFTEADQTVSGGLDLRGNRWRRKDDKVGAAFVFNALSGDHRQYLALGGLGLVLGDGALNYRREKLIESYYTFKLWRGIYLSADFQRVWDPGYNRDRGPALVGALRLHAEGNVFASPR